jgi:SPP1 family predicted phage head-tail adaptor
MTNSGQYKHYISILEKTKTGKTNELGEEILEYKEVKKLFAKIETRVGGLLSGRPADTVMTTVTHKFTWVYNNFPTVLPDKNRISYKGKFFDVNYSLNDEFKDEELQVFATSRA